MLVSQLDPNDMSDVDEIRATGVIAQTNRAASFGNRVVQYLLMFFTDGQNCAVGKVHCDLASQRALLIFSVRRRASRRQSLIRGRYLA